MQTVLAGPLTVITSRPEMRRRFFMKFVHRIRRNEVESASNKLRRKNRLIGQVDNGIPLFYVPYIHTYKITILFQNKFLMINVYNVVAFTTALQHNTILSMLVSFSLNKHANAESSFNKELTFSAPGQANLQFPGCGQCSSAIRKTYISLFLGVFNRAVLFFMFHSLIKV